VLATKRLFDMMTMGEVFATGVDPATCIGVNGNGTSNPASLRMTGWEPF